MPTLDLGKVIGPQGPAGRDGERGPQGIQGIQGPQGVPGPGVPAGGTPGQILSKDSAADYDAKWSDNTAAQVSYNATESGLEAETVQGALDRLSSIKVDVGRVSNPNLLDNWYFADPINQRGRTEYGSGYGIDRWSSAKTIISDGYVSFQDNFIQSFEWDRFKPLLGKIVTLSYLNKDAKLTTATGAIPNSFESNELQGLYFGPFAMYVFPGGSAQVFRLDTSDTIIAAKLELGPVQTLAHKDASGTWVLNDPPPDPTLELAKCQRYQLCQLYGNVNADYIGMNQMIFNIPTPVTMRATPAIFNSDFVVKTRNGIIQTGFIFSCAVRPNFVSVYANKQAHGLTDAILTISNIGLDANL